MGPAIDPKLPERILSGEYKLPLYADLPSMSEHERRAIWGLMVGNEGKTRIPIYYTYGNAGFDPDKDMLQAPAMSPDQYFSYPWWDPSGPRQWRELGFVGGGGLVFDWDLKTTVEGLYAAGMMCYSGGDHATAATTGRYAGRKATENAKLTPAPVIDRAQVDQEKARVMRQSTARTGLGGRKSRRDWRGSCRTTAASTRATTCSKLV
jgi:hypothetical protein